MDIRRQAERGNQLKNEHFVHFRQKRSQSCWFCRSRNTQKETNNVYFQESFIYKEAVVVQDCFAWANISSFTFHLASLKFSNFLYLSPEVQVSLKTFTASFQKVQQDSRIQRARHRMLKKKHHTFVTYHQHQKGRISIRPYNIFTFEFPHRKHSRLKKNKNSFD